MQVASKAVGCFGYGAVSTIRNLGFAVLFIGGAAQAEERVVAILGDSLTAGYGLPAEDGFVPVLQNWLDAQNTNVRLINAGVSGDTTAGGVSRLDWTLTPDVDGLIVALGANDYLRGLDPELARQNLDAILERADAADVDSMLVGIVSGSNYGPDYKAAFDGMYPELAQKHEAPLYPNWFNGIQVDGRVETEFLQADGLHPNKTGVAMIVEDMGPAILAFVGTVD